MVGLATPSRSWHSSIPFVAQAFVHDEGTAPDIDAGYDGWLDDRRELGRQPWLIYGLMHIAQGSCHGSQPVVDYSLSSARSPRTRPSMQAA